MFKSSGQSGKFCLFMAGVRQRRAMDLSLRPLVDLASPNLQAAFEGVLLYPTYERVATSAKLLRVSSRVANANLALSIRNVDHRLSL